MQQVKETTIKSDISGEAALAPHYTQSSGYKSPPVIDLTNQVPLIFIA